MIAGRGTHSCKHDIVFRQLLDVVLAIATVPDENFHPVSGMCLDLVTPLHDGDGRPMGEVECERDLSHKGQQNIYAMTRLGRLESETMRAIIWIVLPILCI